MAFLGFINSNLVLDSNIKFLLMFIFQYNKRGYDIEFMGVTLNEKSKFYIKRCIIVNNV